MKDKWLPCAFFCFGTGVIIGALFLLLKFFRLLFGLKKFGTAALDAVFCVTGTCAVFLCALAVDQGRLRFFQAALHILGAAAIIWALDPLVSLIAGKAGQLLRCAARHRTKLQKHLHVGRKKPLFFAKHPPRQKKGRKPKKRLEKLM